MQRFCDELRYERERRNVSLEFISEVTKVSPRYLRALEAGNYSELPGGVFRKGILRNYLSALSLDDIPWIQRFEADLRSIESAVDYPNDLAQFAENVQRSRPASASRGKDARWLGVAVMASVLVLLGWFVWRFAFHGHIVLSRASALDWTFGR